MSANFLQLFMHNYCEEKSTRLMT